MHGIKIESMAVSWDRICIGTKLEILRTTMQDSIEPDFSWLLCSSLPTDLDCTTFCHLPLSIAGTVHGSLSGSFVLAADERTVDIERSDVFGSV